MTTPTLDVRCPSCGRLAAKLVGGVAEVRRGGELVAAVERGSIPCRRCPGVVEVGPPLPAERPLSLVAAGA